MIWLGFVVACMATPFSVSLRAITDIVAADAHSQPTEPAEPLLCGVCFSPYKEKQCREPEIIQRQVEMLAKIASHIRLYSIDCRQLELVLETIHAKNLTLKVLAGIWTRTEPIDPMLTEFITIVDRNPKYRDYIDGIVVGNEEVFNGRPEHQVIENIQLARTRLANFSIPIGTAETPMHWTPALVGACDVVYANVYSFFDPKSTTKGMRAAARLVVERAEQIPRTGKPVVISETGWPTQGETATRDSYARPTTTNQGRFLESFACRAAKRNLTYFIMEAFDADWKEGPSVEKNFGLMTPDGRLKFNRFKHHVNC